MGLLLIMSASGCGNHNDDCALNHHIECHCDCYRLDHLNIDCDHALLCHHYHHLYPDFFWCHSHECEFQDPRTRSW